MQRAALDFQRKGNVKELDQLRSRYVQLTLAVKCLDSLLHSRDHYTCISSADDIIFKFNLYVCIIKLVSNVLTSKQMYLKVYGTQNGMWIKSGDIAVVFLFIGCA